MSWYFDLEADGLLDQASKVWCGVFKHSESNELKKFRPHEIPQMLEWLKTDPHLIGHNCIGFDLPLLKKLYGYEHQGGVTDTLIISRLHKPNRQSPPHCPNKKAPHSIEAWGYRVGRPKPEHEDWSEFSEEMLHRCSEDVEILQRVHDFLKKEGDGYEWEWAYRLTHQLFKILHMQEEYGWRVDMDQINHNLALLGKWRDKIRRVLDNHLPWICEKEEKKDGDEWTYVKKPFVKSGDYSCLVKKWLDEKGEHNIRGPFCRVNFRKISLDKPEEKKGYLLDQGWIPREWNTDAKGKKTSPKLTKDDPFEGIKGRIGKLIVKYEQAKHREATINGWIKLIRPDGRLPSIVNGLTTTGRAKHSVIVNVPGGDSFFGKQMRKIFSCSPGKILIGCDAAGCQNRMLAARVGDPAFTKTLLEGKKEDKTSIHFVNQRAFAERGYEVSYNMCKNLNYGTLFGASNAKLGRMIGGTGEDGEKIREAILGVAPGFKGLVESLTEEWKRNAIVKRQWGKPHYSDGWIRGLDGRPIFIESEHQILVYMLQSDEAIMMSAAYCFLYKWLIDKGYVWKDDWAYVNWNHDEYTIECEEEYALEVSTLAEQAIVKAGRLYNIACDQEGDAKIGKNWWEVH